MAGTADRMAANDRYCGGNHHQVTYLSADPLTFRLDGCETYQAALVLGLGRYQSGYYIRCRELL